MDSKTPTYYSQHKAECLKRMKEYCLKNKEKIFATRKKYYNTHKKRILKRNSEYRLKNFKMIQRYNHNYYLKHKGVS